MKITIVLLCVFVALLYVVAVQELYYFGQESYPLVQYVIGVKKSKQMLVLTEEPTKEIRKVEISFFTSTPEQTDSTPCISASGEDICLGWLEGNSYCASNDYSFGTELWIFTEGNRIANHCIVTDRINPKYKHRIDYYLGFDKECLNGYQAGDDCPNLRKAKRFGVMKGYVEIIGCYNYLPTFNCETDIE